jgi:hypothetical protein
MQQGCLTGRVMAAGFGYCAALTFQKGFDDVVATFSIPALLDAVQGQLRQHARVSM